jgi:hypothetical protein
VHAFSRAAKECTPLLGRYPLRTSWLTPPIVHGSFGNAKALGYSLGCRLRIGAGCLCWFDLMFANHNSLTRLA